MTNTWSPQEIQELREAFALFDLDGDQCINASELGTIMRSLGQCPTEAAVEKYIKEVDKDGNGVIDFPEFVNIMTANMKLSYTEQELTEAFGVFDRDGSGYVAAAEMRHIMTNVGETLSEREIEDFMREIHIDDEGMISYRDVVKKMMYIAN